MDRVVLERYLAEGKSLEQIGREVGRNPSTVAYWLRQYGLTAVNRAKHAPRGGIPEATLRELIGRGLSGSGIAQELGCSLATVRHWMHRYGLSTRVARERKQNRQARGAGVFDLTRPCSQHGESRFVWVGTGYKCARCNAEAVIRRRRRIKKIFVEEAGGACRLCGYSRYPGALQFHHVDPETKAFGLSRKGATRSLDESRAEAAKCILLCATCHAEVEAGVAGLPVS